MLLPLRFFALAVSLCVVGRDVRPAAHSLSFASPKESKQRKGDPKSATPSLRYGANLCRGTCGVCRRTRCALTRSAQTTAASQTTKHARSDAHAPPQAPRHRRSPRGVNSPSRAIAALGLVLRGAERLRPAGPSAAMARVAGSLLAVPRSAAHGVCMGVEAPMLRGLTCRICLNGAPQARSELCGTPHARAPQVARSEAKGHGQQGRLFFAYFLLAKQKKVSAPPGAHPGQPPQKE